MASSDPVADDRAFLASLSQHRGRPGDTSNLNPQMVAAMAAAIRDARQQGLNVGVESGYRDPNELWSQGERTRAAYFDHNGNSLHSYGLAMDVNGIGPAGSKTAQQWYDIATSHGLYNPYFNNDPGNSEWNHYQLIPDRTPTAAMRTALGTGDWGRIWASVSGGPAIAGGGGTSGGAGASGAYLSQRVQGPLSQSNPFISALGNAESNWRNIPSQVDKDPAGFPGGKSQGYLQIDTPTWRQYAKQAGVTAPDAMSASMEDQIKVASLIPFSRFGPRTQNLLHKQFGQFDNTETVGQLAANFTPGTTINTTGGPSVGSQTGSAAAAPPAVASGTPTTPGAWGSGQPAGALAGFQAGSPAEKSMNEAAKTLGWTGGGDSSQSSQTPPVGPAPMMTSPTTGGMTGPNIMGPRAAAEMALRAQGFSTQPMPANLMPTGAITAPTPAGMPGQATGLPQTGLGMGTSINSPGQLQMAMLYGFPPYAGSYGQPGSPGGASFSGSY